MAKSKINGDSLPTSKLIRILFPEIQVIDHIKENGVINKEHFKKNNKVLNNTITNTKSNVSKKANYTVANVINSATQSAENVKIKSKNVATESNKAINK